MKVLVIYRPDSEHGRLVEEFIRDYQLRHDTVNKLEVLNVDGRDGGAMASLYDVMQYPAIVVTRNDGSEVKRWEGEALPLMDELAYYTFNQS